MTSCNYVATVQQARYILNINMFSHISCIYAIYREYYYLAIVPGGVATTTILYWRNRRSDCWERYLDITFVCLSFVYQSYFAISAQNMFYYFLSMLVGVSSFTIGKVIAYYNISNDDNLAWLSIYFHSGVHIFGNLANIILYSGII